MEKMPPVEKIYEAWSAVADGLPLDRLEAERYADVNWKKINTEYHNNYSAALAEIEAVRDIDTRLITEAADRVMARLSELPVTVRRGPLRPPR